MQKRDWILSKHVQGEYKNGLPPTIRIGKSQHVVQSVWIFHPADCDWWGGKGVGEVGVGTHSCPQQYRFVCPEAKGAYLAQTLNTSLALPIRAGGPSGTLKVGKLLNRGRLATVHPIQSLFRQASTKWRRAVHWTDTA